MNKAIKLFALIFSIIFITSFTAYAGGLSTTFVEVKLKGLKPGKTYSMREEKGKSLIVSNTTEDTTVDIAVEPETPVDYNLVPGYEPIPDLSWIEIEKNSFKEIGPGQAAETDISITIPKGKKHRGKKYQVYIYSHTTGQATFRTGLMSRILFEIANESPPKGKGKKQLDRER